MARAEPTEPWKYVTVGLTKHRLDVEDLDLTERGAYEALRMRYLESKKALPKDPHTLYRLAGAHDKRERKAVDAVLEKKFELGSDGLWHNAFCDEELTRIERVVENKRAGGRASAQVRWGNKGISEGNTCYPAVSPVLQQTDRVKKLSSEVVNKLNSKKEKTTTTNTSCSFHEEREDVKDVLKNIPAPVRGNGAGKKNNSLISSSKEDVPAPPQVKGAEAGSRVGADMSQLSQAAPSTHIPQVTAKGPSVSSAPADKSPPLRSGSGQESASSPGSLVESLPSAASAPSGTNEPQVPELSVRQQEVLKMRAEDDPEGFGALPNEMQACITANRLDQHGGLALTRSERESLEYISVAQMFNYDDAEHDKLCACAI